MSEEAREFLVGLAQVMLAVGILLAAILFMIAACLYMGELVRDAELVRELARIAARGAV